MARRKVPSSAVNGAETFSDSLVGRQITDGTSQLSNTNFALDTVITQRDTKTFRTNPFSDFLTLDDLKSQTSNGERVTSKSYSKKKELKFKGDKNNASKSLFGSLKERIYVSVKNIIENFPAGLLLDESSFVSTNGGNTAYDINYDVNLNTTTFKFETNMLYNPFDLLLKKPNSNDIPEVNNSLRNFYSSYKKYVLDLNGNTYDIINYTEPSVENVSTLKVYGNPFSGFTGYSENILIRPNDGITEEFFIGLDDLESTLLNRESTPIYNAPFRVPRDTFGGSKTEIVSLEFNWPVSSKDNWNLQIVGLEYEKYIDDLINVSEEIDNYKSNLFVRFLASPQLFEFDTDDQKVKSIFQLYGQSFDSVKKFIDNIVHVRSVTYDGVNNLPDLLLKNLANTLGLETVDLIDSNSLDELLYTKVSTNYDGVGSSISAVDAEYEFYRRLLVNLAHLYKSKGTRKSIEFFLRFLGAPEPLIKIDQYVYHVTSFPKSNDLEGDIYDVIAGTKINNVVTGFTTSSYTYATGTTTGSTVLNRAGYPVQENTFFPRAITGTTGDYFFQKGAGWYNETLQHRSSLILDEENSTLTGRIKDVRTRNKPYTYGEDYFDFYRTLPGLDTGYELKSEVDNDFTSLADDNSPLVLGRKNINIFISPAQGVDYDIWRKSRELEITFGSNSLEPQTGVTFAEFVSQVMNKQIKNSHTIKYKKNYIKLEDIYRDYMSQTGFTPYNFVDVNEFINKITPYWVQILEQFIPATTLWTGGNLISNSVFGRPKYQYKFGCQPLVYKDLLYPEDDFLTEIQYWNNEYGWTTEVLELGEYRYDGHLYLFPTFTLDGVNYSGSTGATGSYVLVSGYTSNLTGTTKNAKLYDWMGEEYYLTGSPYNTITYSDTTSAIHALWEDAVIGTINHINSSYTINNPGYLDYYGPFTGATGVIPSGSINQKILSYEIFNDIDGKRKIKVITHSYGADECFAKKSIEFNISAVGFTDVVNCDFSGGTGSYSEYTGCTFYGGTGSYLLTTPLPTNTPIPTSTPTNTPTPLPATVTPTPTNTLTPTVTPVPATHTPTPTSTPIVTSTPTPTATETPTPTPVDCAFEIIVNPILSTPTPTPTPTSSISTVTPTPTATETPTPTPVDCAFEIIVNVVLPATSTPTPTNTNTPTPTNTLEPDAPTLTPTPTATETPTPTPVDCAFEIIVNPVVSTPTPTPSPLPATYTPTPTNTITPEPATDTPTPTPTNTITPEPATDTPTPTPTPTFPPCVTSVTFDVDSAGLVRYTDCCGVTNYIEYGIGPQVINDCIEYNSVFAVGAIISFVTYNNTACICPATPTPTVTPEPATDTPTPTPTPTSDPYVYFSANVGTCTNCGPAPIPTEEIKFLKPFTPTSGKVYVSNPFLGYFYSNLTSIPTNLNARLMSPTEYSDCASACGFTPTPTPTPTNTLTPTATPTPTPSPLPCECWTVVNEDTVSINYSVTNCDGSVISPNLLPGSRFNHCIKGGTFPTVNSPIGGTLGEYQCETNCTQGGGECSDCGPTPTPTATPTATPTNTPQPATATPTPAPFSACMGEYSIGSTCSCDGLSYGGWTFYGNGTGICNSSTISSTGILSELNLNAVFYISDGTNIREYTKVGSNMATANGDCFSCPTPTPTELPTSTPTNTPTPLPATYTPTPTNTNTPTPTNTNTPTPLPPTATPFQTTFSGYVSLVNGPDACAGGGYGTVNITVQGTSLCNLTKVLGLSSTLYGNVYNDMTNDTTFWISNGTDEREFMRDGSAQTGTPQTSCTACPAAPTAVPTLEPTLPPTLEPTLPPTLPPTLEPTLPPTLPPTLEPTPSPTCPPYGTDIGGGVLCNSSAYYDENSPCYQLGGQRYYLRADGNCGSYIETLDCGCDGPTPPTPSPTTEPTLTPGNNCYQGQSGTIYNTLSECMDSNDGPCSIAVCPEGPQP